ncbi:cro-like repressor [Streptococcus phage 9B4]|nr:cro-like repressor [Streptococcus phage 9B4]
MEFKYDKLKGRIKEKYGTQENFAEAIGKTQTTTSFKINGKASWNQDEIVKAIEVLGLSKDDIVEYFFNY